jgi:hypothetical protein
MRRTSNNFGGKAEPPVAECPGYRHFFMARSTSLSAPFLAGSALVLRATIFKEIDMDMIMTEIMKDLAKLVRCPEEKARVIQVGYNCDLAFHQQELFIAELIKQNEEMALMIYALQNKH